MHEYAIDLSMTYIGKFDEFPSSLKVKDGDFCIVKNKEYVYCDHTWQEVGEY